MRTRIDHTKFDLSAANLRQHFSPYSARRGCELSLYMSLMPLKKKSNGCFPMGKFHEIENFMKSRSLDLGLVTGLGDWVGPQTVVPGLVPCVWA